MSVRALSTLLASGVLLLAAHSSAYCQATSCDPSKALCARDAQSCLTTGLPLAWSSSCLQVYVQADGSPAQGISFDAAKASVTRAFDTWLAADCGKAAPSLSVQVLGPIACDASEYNPTQKNANIVVFRDKEWPYIGGEDALGFTHLRFDPKTGELWDADIEINAVAEPYSIGEPVTGADLDSVLTHEAGHLLGLAHTLAKDATMFSSYTPGTDTLKTLAADDVRAVCAVYSPERVPSRTSCAPRHGFSAACGADQPENSATNEGTDQEVTPADGNGSPASKGCAMGFPQSQFPCWPSALLGAAAVGLILSRRRARRHQLVSCAGSARPR